MLPALYKASLAEYGLDWIDPAAAVLLRYDRCEWMLRAEQTIEYLYILLSGKGKGLHERRKRQKPTAVLLCFRGDDGRYRAVDGSP